MGFDGKKYFLYKYRGRLAAVDMDTLYLHYTILEQMDGKVYSQGYMYRCGNGRCEYPLVIFDSMGMQSGIMVVYKELGCLIGFGVHNGSLYLCDSLVKSYGDFSYCIVHSIVRQRNGVYVTELWGTYVDGYSVKVKFRLSKDDVEKASGVNYRGVDRGSAVTGMFYPYTAKQVLFNKLWWF